MTKDPQCDERGGLPGAAESSPPSCGARLPLRRQADPRRKRVPTAACHGHAVKCRLSEQKWELGWSAGSMHKEGTGNQVGGIEGPSPHPKNGGLPQRGIQGGSDTHLLEDAGCSMESRQQGAEGRQQRSCLGSKAASPRGTSEQVPVLL